MVNISVDENDFMMLANAADEAKRRGDKAEAETLDILARKANAALTNEKYKGVQMLAGLKRLSWREVPSTLGV